MRSPEPTTALNPDGPGLFLTTRWSRVVLAGAASSDEAHEALADLCRDYWKPLYHFARRKGHAPEDAQDFTQGFIARLLEKNGIAAADRERGRFRTFLLSAFSHYLAGQSRDAAALKRGGGCTFVSLDEVPEDGPARQLTSAVEPELHFEQQWALAMLERVMTRLREEYAAAGRTALFEALQPSLSGALGRPGYAGLGTALGMSESAVAVAMHRMRRRYGDILREEIAATLTDKEELEDELRHLKRVLTSA